MAMNPMQRKIRNSFLFGFLIAVIVAAIIIGFLFMKIKGLNSKMQEEIEKARIATVTCYATTGDVRKDGLVEVESVDVIASHVPDGAVTDLDEYSNEQGELQMVALADLDKGTVLTKSLVAKSDKAGSYREVEFNSILLPTLLEKGEYVDIRVQFVDSIDSLDFVVLSRVKVQECTSSSIWLKLTDAELQLIDCAIVESWAIEGARVYATRFADDAQPEIAATYVPSPIVEDMIKANASIDSDIKIADRSSEDPEYAETARSNIELLKQMQEDVLQNTRDGLKSEVTAIQAAREAILGEEY